MGGFVLLGIGYACLLCTCRLFMCRRESAASACSLLLPVHVEVEGTSQVIALRLDGARTAAALRKLVAESYAEVGGRGVAEDSMFLELEENDGRFSVVEDGRPLKSARLATARSLYVTARPLVMRSLHR